MDCDGCHTEMPPDERIHQDRNKRFCLMCWDGIAMTAWLATYSAPARSAPRG